MIGMWKAFQEMEELGVFYDNLIVLIFIVNRQEKTKNGCCTEQWLFPNCKSNKK